MCIVQFYTLKKSSVEPPDTTPYWIKVWLANSSNDPNEFVCGILSFVLMAVRLAKNKIVKVKVNSQEMKATILAEMDLIVRKRIRVTSIQY